MDTNPRKNRLTRQKKSNIQVSGEHIQVSKTLHMKYGSCTWYRFLVTAHAHRHTQRLFYFIIIIDLFIIKNNNDAICIHIAH